mmetsp:Transcript_40457/g.116860  ORF Transcript_40457/g.116860 Transcript_40457/m.116860 type:complete len:318 (+) Transcript_40457:613-1566(+)
MKQKAVSGRSLRAFAALQASQPAEHTRQRRVARTLKRTPMARKTNPVSMRGKTVGSLRNGSAVVLLPSIVNSTICPKTQTPPSMASASCRTSASTHAAKHAPKTITNSSGLNTEPEAMPIGMSGGPASSFIPRPKDTSAMAKTMRNDSTGAPVKTCRPQTFTCDLRGMSIPLTAPITPPASRVKAIRSTFATTMRPTGATFSPAGFANPDRMLNTVKTYDASSGAHVKTSRGSGWSGKALPSSFIFGMTRPSPRAQRTVPRSSASIAAYSKTTSAYAARASSSKVTGTHARTTVATLTSWRLISRPALRSTRKKAPS